MQEICFHPSFFSKEETKNIFCNIFLCALTLLITQYEAFVKAFTSGRPYWLAGLSQNAHKKTNNSHSDLYMDSRLVQTMYYPVPIPLILYVCF